MRIDNRITVNAWFAEHPFPGYLDPIRKIAGEFERRHPEYRIAVHGHDFRELPEAVRSAARTGDGPDIAEYYYTATQLARDTRNPDGTPYFTTVADAIGRRQDVLGEPVALDDIIPAVREFYSIDGRLASVPAVATTTLMFANRTMLDAAGVTHLPETWQELTRACQRLAGGPAGGVTWPNHGWLFLQALAVQGGLLTDHDNGRSGRATTVNLASTELLDYARWWQQLRKDGHYFHTGSASTWDWEGCLRAFLSGEVAFVMHTSKITDLIVDQAKTAGFEVEVGRLPHNGDRAYAGHLLAGQSLWLADGLDRARADGALAFLLYLINPRNAADWHRETGFTPVTESAVRLLDNERWFDEHPAHRVAIDQLRRTNCSPAALGPLAGDLAGIQQCLIDAMADILTKDADPVDRLASATIAAQQLLDSYNTERRQPDTAPPLRWTVA